MDIDKTYLAIKYSDEPQPSFLFFLRNQSNNYFYLTSIGARVCEENPESIKPYSIKTRYSASFKEVVFGMAEDREEAVKLAFTAALILKDNFISLFKLGSNHFLNETGMKIEIPPIKKRRSRLEKQIDNYLPFRQL